MNGKIIKGIAGFYYIYIEEKGLYECKAKGIFRNRKIKPLVGDNVYIDILDEQNQKGNIIDILERKNELLRPAVANVDQAFVIFAAAEPEPNLNLLDRFLVTMEKQKIKTILCFNKIDIVNEKKQEYLAEIYANCGYQVVFTSIYSEEGLKKVKEILRNKTTTLAGPSGVGKSSIMNFLNPSANMEIGSISEKIKRGKHTTRHSELIPIEEQTYVMDTPGFSSLYLENFQKEELKNYFLEFLPYQEKCRFQGCVHINEPDCAVKEALEKKQIHEIRYKSYLELYTELKNKRRW